MELKRLTINEEGEKKNKSLTLKVEEPDSNGDMDLMVKNFKRFMKNQKKKIEDKVKDEEKKPSILTCQNCGKKGHIIPYRPLLKKGNKKQKNKKAYVPWEDNDMESSDDEEEKSNICLMTKHQDDKVNS